MTKTWLISPVNETIHIYIFTHISTHTHTHTHTHTNTHPNTPHTHTQKHTYGVCFFQGLNCSRHKLLAMLTSINRWQCATTHSISASSMRCGWEGGWVGDA